ncbi:MAG: AMP-binding protein [Pseudorhodoplanes sp.]|jgi:fatty-acyl-CoA synthase|nr:AMP-binding protein [Pseudorhodoplanes sp.]
MLGTLRDCLEANARRWPDRPAIIGEERVYTYAELDAHANRLAHLLHSLGLRKGDAVGLLLNNCPEFAIGFVACQKLGVLSSALNYRLSPAAIGNVVEQEALAAIIFNAGFSRTVEGLIGRGNCRYIGVGQPLPRGVLDFADCAGEPATPPPPAAIASGDLCNVIHTSGTTGVPKGAAFTHATQILTAIQYCLEMGLDRGHVGMSLAPVVIGAATNFFVAYLFVGASQVMISDYEAKKALRLIERHKVTELFAVPTQMHQLLEARAELAALDIGSLRLLRSGGSPLPKTLLHQVRCVLGCEVLNTYGTTESCTAITTCHTGLEPEDKWESIGKPSYFQEVRVIRAADGIEAAPDEVIAMPGEGQLINRGPQCISDYFCSPGETLRAREGWQYARDIVRLDRDGYLYPVDRVDNVIISGGENIYPQEVEFFLSKHPGIADVAVCGVADLKWGQLVKALVVRRSPDLTPEEIDRFCLDSDELPRSRRPKIIEFVNELPRNVLGKIDRTALR